MRILLDTHIILWAVTDSPKLPDAAREMIQDERNQIYFSAASIWEVAIKHSMSPDQLPVSAEHASGVAVLPPVHKDPFDRILVAQAVAEPMRFLTHDRLLEQYGSPVFIV